MSGGRWFVGSFEQTLPPIVPRFRTCTSAIVEQTSPRIGRARASADAAMSVYVAIAPIVSIPSPPSSIPFRSSSPFRSTSTSGEAARDFITLINVWPPARARAPSFCFRIASASARDAGFAYSTSRSSTGAILLFHGERFRMNALRSGLERAARAAHADRDDLGEHRERRLRRRARAEVEAARPRDPVDACLRNAGLAQQRVSTLLVSPGAE